MFMSKHSAAGGGNGVFTLYNQIGDHFWNLIQFIIEKVPADKIVYVIMHEEANELGEIKPKTIGKLLDEKVCIEGMFTIVLRCIVESNKHLFVTQAADGAVSKSPIGMFEDAVIDNDMLLVEKAIISFPLFDFVSLTCLMISLCPPRSTGVNSPPAGVSS